MKKLTILLSVMALGSVVWAGQPTFTYNKSINYGPHPTVGNPYAAATRSLGGVVFGDGFDQGIFRVANPLTSDGGTDSAANTWNINTEADLLRGFATGGHSFQGICYDGANYFASGTNGTGCTLVQLTDSGNDTTRWTPGVLVTMPAGNFSGCTAVGTNQLVMANYDTGALAFFTVSGSSATTSTASIVNPAAAGYRTTMVQYYSTGSQKYIFAYMADATHTRRVDVFNTNGTAAGTTYAGTLCAGIASNFTIDAPDAYYSNHFSSLAADPVKKVLVAAVTADTVGNNANGFDAFDISTVTTTGTAVPYAQIRATELGVPTKKNIAGLAFFGSSANLAVTHGNYLSVFDVGAVTAVSDWVLYR